MDLLDNQELEELMTILEEATDEEKAVVLLKEFNEAKAAHGRLLMNRDPDLDHEEWKKLCDQALDQVRVVVEKIRSMEG